MKSSRTGAARALVLLSLGAFAGCGPVTSESDAGRDAGSTGPDAGSTQTDAGSSGTDAGPVTLDAGATDAGGASETDARAGTDASVTTDAGLVADSGLRADGGGGAMGGSAGCGRPSTLTAGTFVSQPLAGGREYFVRLPAGYDRTRRYPVIYQFHGCSTQPARQDNNVPVHNQSGANAIVVRGRAAGNCWDTNAMGPDVAYADAMMAAVEASLCVDTTKRFATGYSSGSFMTHRLGCIRGAMFRGIATIAGGQADRSCTGPVAALLIHDLNDSTVNISASVSARDSHIARNMCNASAARTPFAPAPCESYAGCAAGLPVVFCQTSGQDHSRQDSLAAPAFWNFFSSLPAR